MGALLASWLGYILSFFLSGVLLGVAAAVSCFVPWQSRKEAVKTHIQGGFIKARLLPLGLVYALAFLLALVPTGVIEAIWSLYMLDHNASLFLIGFSYTAFGVSHVVVSPLAGRWSDRYGRYWLLIAGLLALGIIYTGYGFLVSLLWIVILCVVEGVALALAGRDVDGLLADLAPEGMEGRVQAMFSAASTAGSFLGATLAGFLYALGPGVPFLTIGPLYVFGALVLLSPRLRQVCVMKK